MTEIRTVVLLALLEERVEIGAEADDVEQRALRDRPQKDLKRLANLPAAACQLPGKKNE